MCELVLLGCVFWQCGPMEMLEQAADKNEQAIVGGTESVARTSVALIRHDGFEKEKVIEWLDNGGPLQPSDANVPLSNEQQGDFWYTFYYPLFVASGFAAGAYHMITAAHLVSSFQGQVNPKVLIKGTLPSAANGNPNLLATHEVAYVIVHPDYLKSRANTTSDIAVVILKPANEQESADGIFSPSDRIPLAKTRPIEPALASPDVTQCGYTLLGNGLNKPIENSLKLGQRTHTLNDYTPRQAKLCLVSATFEQTDLYKNTAVAKFRNLKQIEPKTPSKRENSGLLGFISDQSPFHDSTNCNHVFGGMACYGDSGGPVLYNNEAVGIQGYSGVLWTPVAASETRPSGGFVYFECNPEEAPYAMALAVPIHENLNFINAALRCTPTMTPAECTASFSTSN